MLQIRQLLILPILLLCGQPVFSQDIDYLKHGKIFCLCSMKRECTNCFSCDKDRYLVRIDNHTDKRIKNVYFSFYSSVFNKILEKEAKIAGDRIEKKQIGQIHVCVPDGRHWIISKIIYDDGSADKFTIQGRMDKFLQEPDECDCND